MTPCRTCAARDAGECAYPQLPPEQVEACLRLPKRSGRYDRLQLRALSDVQSRAVRFIVPGLIPLRALTLLAGVGGFGKSTWAAGVAARESRGEYDGGTPHSVLVISFEDTAEEVWRPRILAANGDPARVIEVRVELDEGGVVVLPADLEALEKAVRDHDVRLVVVDPIIAAIDLKLDSHKDQHVRNVLGKLTRLAELTDSAVLGIGHLNKTPSADAYIRIANSVAFWNAARSVVLVTKEDEQQRLVSQVKANWARSSSVRRYRLEEVELPDELDATTGRPVTTSRLVYVEDAEGVEADDVLRGRPDEGEEGKRIAALRFLAGQLSGGDWRESAELKREAVERGISERTLKRAAEELAVEHDRRGFPAVTWWRLASRASPTPESVGPTVEPASANGSQPLASPVGPVSQLGHEGNGRGTYMENEAAVTAALEAQFEGATWLE